MFNITDKISKNKSFTGITADDNINADEAEVRRLNDSQEARLKAIDDYLSGASTSSVKSKTRMSSKSMSKHHRLLAHEGELRSSSSLLFPGNDGKSGENTDNANVDGSNRMSTSMMLRLMGDTKYDDKENSFDSSNVHTQDEDEVQTQEMIGLWQKAKHHLRSLQVGDMQDGKKYTHTQVHIYICAYVLHSFLFQPQYLCMSTFSKRTRGS